MEVCEAVERPVNRIGKLIRDSDEISALVLDPGYSTIRAGFAGEDVPKSVIPSSYGLVPVDKEPGETRKLFGDNSINTPLNKIDIRNVMGSDGNVADWDTAASLWEYAITSRLTSTRPGNQATNGLDNEVKDEDAMEGVESTEAQEKPVGENALLMTETGWNPAKSREKGLEVAMESWGVPAYWLANNGVLAAYVCLFNDAEIFEQYLTNAQLRRRSLICPGHRRWSRKHICNAFTRRDGAPKRRSSLPISRKLYFFTTPRPLRLIPTTKPISPPLPHFLQNPS